MRTAERRKEIVERFLVRQVGDRHSRAPSETIAMEQIVVAHCQVKKVPRRDPRRILVVILRALRRNADPRRPSCCRVRSATGRIAR